MPRAQRPSGKQRHGPLHVELDQDEAENKYGRPSAPGKRTKSSKKKNDDLNDSEVRIVFSAVIVPTERPFTR